MNYGQDIKRYYNEESTQYSHKRYEGVTDTYVKFFFKRRLALVLQFFSDLAPRALRGRSGRSSLLEVGTADGVVLREIVRKLPNKFKQLVGVDIAAKMIGEARALTSDKKISFFEISQVPAEKFDAILFVGFMTEALWQEYQPFIREHLDSGGYVIISLAGAGSLHARFKLAQAPYVADYRSYGRYRQVLSQDFQILAEKHYGLFIPKLWAWPALARLIQPLVDRFLVPFLPNLFHECLYLVRSNSR